MKPRGRPLIFLLLLLLLLPARAASQEDVPSPLDRFGFQMGADYHLADYDQLGDYWRVLARLSDRMVLDTIGRSSNGRPQLMAIITSPENHRDLERYRRISERLTRADGVSEDEARRLAREGKPVVWIDGGLHASEVLGAQQLVELVYRMVEREDPETMRILDDVILLAVHANPDGHDLLADWYMRRDDPRSRTTRGVPVLYQEYAGHDNNRDFYMSNLVETTNMNRVLYREWYPQIVYDHHQTGPQGTIMFAPPFRDPANHYLHSLILTSIQQVGSAMHHRFVVEGKGGTTMRSGASYSTWWNGGLRTTPYFHNMIGLLTETRGHPNPIEVPFIPERQVSTDSDLPLPVEPTETWHFRQSVEYSQTANRAVLDYASRNGDMLLLNAWRMGRSAIQRGRTDSWTVLPREVDRAAQILGSRDATASRVEWEQLLRHRDDRDPRGYVLPADQPDFNTATKFVNALIKNGIEVHRATSEFTIEGETYPEGSWVIRMDQAFQPFILDMFEPQNYPDDFAYPGGPPVPPYDNAGWTLAYQMDVEFTRILDGFDGPFEPVEGLVEPPAGTLTGPDDADGFLLDHRVNDSFRAVNRMLDDGRRVYWLLDSTTVAGRDLGSGAFYVPADDGARRDVRRLAGEEGLDVTAVADRPAAPALELSRLRVGLWDEYGGSIASGWTRFVLEQFGFDFELVFPQELDSGDLHERYDVLIFPDGAIPAPSERRTGGFQPPSDEIPERWRDRLGHVTTDRTIPRILRFLRDGGTVIAVGSSTDLGYHAGLPIRNWLVDQQRRPLPSEEYYVPGSVLEVRLEHETPVTHGLGPRANVLFSRSPVFGLRPGASREGVRSIATFDSPEPLRSGWAWGQHHLLDGTTMLEAPVGEGRLFLFGPDITFRGQSHGTFPLLFNAMYYGAAREVEAPPTGSRAAGAGSGAR